MTAPTPFTHGYTDYGRFAATSDVTVVDVSAENTVALTTKGPFFVGNLDYLVIKALCPTRGLRIVVRWSSTSTFTNTQEPDDIHGLAGDLITVCLPIKGPWVRFEIELSAYPGLLDMFVSQVPNDVNTVTSTGHNALISQDATNVVTGTTPAFNATAVRSGWAYWHATLDGGGNFRCKLYAVGFTGALTLLDMFDHNHQKQGALLLIPPMHMRITVFNNDLIDHAVYVTLLFHPHKT